MQRIVGYCNKEDGPIKQVSPQVQATTIHQLPLGGESSPDTALDYVSRQNINCAQSHSVPLKTNSVTSTQNHINTHKYSHLFCCWYMNALMWKNIKICSVVFSFKMLYWCSGTLHITKIVHYKRRQHQSFENCELKSFSSKMMGFWPKL